MFIRLRIYLHIILSLVVGKHALENLALNKTAEMSTQRTDDSGADAAVDGNTAQTISSASCALTALDYVPEAWWRVDLNGTFAISELKIYLLNRELYLFRFYSVHFTDELTNWRSSSHCTKDHSDADGPSSSVVRLNCDGKGRYLTIWLNRAIDCKRKDPIYHCDILQLCEVQILGCYPGNYSQNCNMTCPVNCRDDICSIDDGLCYECKDGYLGDTCDTECEPGKFGRKCSQVCNGRCRGEQTCSHINGYCPNGCMDGYIGTYCNKTCSHGLFGFNCTQECGNCLNNKTCIHTNGFCDNGCASGWNGSYCNTSCGEGRYGVNCRNTCSVHCQDSSGCDIFTGTCTDGCKDGWTGQLCDKKCRHGKYGSNCTGVCGNCYQNKTCDNVNGICKDGCDKGWEGTHCKTECDAYTFGYNCSEKCSSNCRDDGKCNKYSGTCDAGCKKGWTGEYCNQTCTYGTYGYDCAVKCSGNCKNNTTCDTIDGSCSDGCKEGWEGIDCNKSCEDGRYGENCTGKCGSCSKSPCLRTNGTCLDGCTAGFKGSQCKTDCSSGEFGDNCRYNCSRHCLPNYVCDKKTGHCPNGCDKGWTGGYCNTTCTAGTFGYNCNETCGHCLENDNCSNYNGTCPRGCQTGRTGDTCKEWCPDGTYGFKCEANCSSNCNTTCNKTTGECDTGCIGGWAGLYCNKSCDQGTYGPGCIYNCSGNCKGNDSCSIVDGSCPNGCDEGWRADTCHITCGDGRYGENCSGQCGSCFNYTCLRTNGTCLDGCAAGFKGSQCKTDCSSGAFGENCRYNCSRHCLQNDVCDKKTGHCPKGCDKGWTGDHCNTTCKAGTFGHGCNETCGHCLENDNCSNYNGTCPRGCQTGRKGDTCKEWCPDGTYGFKCEANCSSNCNTTCNKTTGECDTGCIGGWAGLYCNKSCDQGTYGPGCMYNCSGNCKENDSCSIVDGSCPNGCDEGWRADTCHISCIDGAYGENCQYQCGGCHNQTVCNIKTGVCDRGCMEGYHGPRCQKNKTSEETIIMHPEEPPVIPIISGVTIATILIVIVLVVLLILRKRRIQETKTDQQTPQPLQPMKSVYENVSIRATNRTKRQSYTYANVQFEMDTEDKDFGIQEENRSSNVYYNNTNTKFVKNIPVSDLKDVIESKSLDKNKIFLEEFDALPKGFIEKCDVAKEPKNIPKNRYKSTFAYDHSRVILKGNNDNDYINANYLDGTLSPKKYIASQGPKESTFRDHWCMIWQEQVEKIVMLTNLVENRKIKCDQYWPDDNRSSLHAGEFNISIVSEQVVACYTIRNLTVTNEDLNETRNVTHYHFTTWPDHGVPDPLELVLFHIRVNTTETYGPLLVHCSAGIGRTGTYIALDALMDSCRESGTINVFEYVRLMRNDRVGMIQTLNQYIVAHTAVLEHLRTVHHNIPKATFADDVTIKLNSEQRDDFEEEFKVIESMKPNYNNEDFKTGLLEKNNSKNVTKDILPVDMYAAFLPSNVKGQVEYINAVYVPSYTDHHGFIVTQIPTLETDSEFLSLLFDHYVTTVVVLLSDDEDVTKCPWLSCTKRETHRGVVKLQSIDVSYQENDIEERVVTLNRKTREISVQVLSVSCLKEEEIDSTKLHTLVRDGVMGCGVLLTLYNAIQQLQLDDEVDIPTIVRRMKVRRPQLCSNSSEYMLCYRIVAEYLIETNVYANN